MKSKGTILVVDDSTAVLETMQELLDEAGYEAHTTDNPILVPTLLRQHKPHLVLVDVDMPAIDGGRLIANMGAGGQQIRFALHSGKPEADLEDLQRATGALGFIQKSTHPHDLLATIDGWMRDIMRTAR